MAILEWTDNYINELIHCPKVFRSKPPEVYTYIQKSYRINFNIFRKEDSKDVFEVFIRYLALLPQSFSVGLMYSKKCLYRCNGYHGATKKGFYLAEHHQYPHCHILTEEDVEAGRDTDPSLSEDLTGKYINLPSAIVYFCKTCGIIGCEKYFHPSQQICLFSEEGSVGDV